MEDSYYVEVLNQMLKMCGVSVQLHGKFEDCLEFISEQHFWGNSDLFDLIIERFQKD